MRDMTSVYIGQRHFCIRSVVRDENQVFYLQTAIMSLGKDSNKHCHIMRERDFSVSLTDISVDQLIANGRMKRRRVVVERRSR